MADSNIHLGDLTGYLARVNAQVPSISNRAELSFGMESIEDFEGDVPTILCYPGDQFSTQTGDTPRCRQSQKFSVNNIVICALTDLPTVLGELRAAIVGWPPDMYSEQFKFTHRNIRFAGPMALKADYIWWEEIYESSKQHIGQ